MYRFVGQDDTYGVEVRDLNSFLASKHAILFKPSIVIEDEEFISQSKWKAIKEMYNAAKLEDLDKMLNLSVNDFTNALISLPKGYKDLVARVVSDRVQNGTFDSIGKIKAVDSICGTELMLLIK